MVRVTRVRVSVRVPSDPHSGFCPGGRNPLRSPNSL